MMTLICTGQRSLWKRTSITLTSTSSCRSLISWFSAFSSPRKPNRYFNYAHTHTRTHHMAGIPSLTRSAYSLLTKSGNLEFSSGCELWNRCTLRGCYTCMLSRSGDLQATLIKWAKSAVAIMAVLTRMVSVWLTGGSLGLMKWRHGSDVESKINFNYDRRLRLQSV